MVVEKWLVVVLGGKTEKVESRVFGGRGSLFIVARGGRGDLGGSQMGYSSLGLD